MEREAGRQRRCESVRIIPRLCQPAQTRGPATQAAGMFFTGMCDFFLCELRTRRGRYVRAVICCSACWRWYTNNTVSQQTFTVKSEEQFHTHPDMFTSESVSQAQTFRTHGGPDRTHPDGTGRTHPPPFRAPPPAAVPPRHPWARRAAQTGTDPYTHTPTRSVVHVRYTERVRYGCSTHGW